MGREEKLVITIIEHSLFGYLFQPVWVVREGMGSLSILETAGKNSSERVSLRPEQREIIALAGHCSDKSLMKSYSRETTVSGFLKNVTKETVLHYIRPAIERYQRRIMEHLQPSGLEVYLRGSIKKRVLFESDRLDIASGYARAVFNFTKNGQQGLRYSITIASGNEQIDLNGKPFGIICNDPACVFVGRQLLVFEDIDAKKLLPFFSKEHITVPVSSERAYIEKFVAGCIKNNVEVNARGISIEEIRPQRRARLLLENGLDTLPVLTLDFMYDGKAYPFDTPKRKVVYARQKGGDTSLAWFYRDSDWEASLVNILRDNGLERKWINGFRVKSSAPEEGTGTLIDWIQAHRDLLSPFDLEQDIPDQKYFLGEVLLESGLEEKQDWFDLKSEAVFAEFRIPFIRFKNYILNGIREYVLPDGSIAILPSEWYSRYYELVFFGREEAGRIRLGKYYSGSIALPSIDADRPLPDILPEELYPVPEGLNATLRPYQHKGFCWLLSLAVKRLGGCLADDMGLGKTLQAIALLQHFHLLRQKEKSNRKLDKANLGLYPISKPAGQLSLFEEDNLHPNACQEYPPSLVVVPASLLHNWQNELQRFTPGQKVYLYSGDKRIKTRDLDAFFRMYDVVLTTYGTLRVDIEALEGCFFCHLILDESQYVKNPDSATYKAAVRIRAMHRLALTGTPVENSLMDLWAQMNIVNEGLLGSRKAFRQAYGEPLGMDNKEKVPALLKIIRPFILRRTKDEVAPELPPLTEETVYCDMSEQQTEVYNMERNKLRNGLIGDSPNLAFMALQGLTRLRLLANHPKLLDLSYPGDSGKFEQVIMHLKTLRSGNHKVLVFSSFVKYLRLFSGYFDRNGWKYAWLTGETAIRDREKEIDRYMQEPDVTCFFISMKAGGVGLNLTAADYVLILDPWWNPAVENQAVSRSHRMGQDRHVIVYRFVSSGTIEEKIRRLQNGKSRLAETFTSSSNPLQAMTKEEMDVLLE